MPLEQWNSLKLDSIDGVTFKKEKAEIISSPIEKDKFGDLKDKIMEKLKTRSLKISTKPLPVVRVFGVGKLITAQAEEDYKTAISMSFITANAYGIMGKQPTSQAGKDLLQIDQMSIIANNAKIAFKGGDSIPL